MTAPRRTTFTAQDGVSLKEHLECRLLDMGIFITGQLASRDRLMDEKFEARDKALVVAWESLKAKMIDENGVRDQLSKQAEELVRRVEYKGDIGRLNVEVQDLREYRATMEGKASQTSVNVVTIMSVISLLLALISLAARFLGM